MSDFIKYAGTEATERIAYYIKKRLETVTVMPESSEEDSFVLYLGPTTDTYIQNTVYKWDGTEWIAMGQEGSGGGKSIIMTLVAANWDQETKQQSLIFTKYNPSSSAVIGMPASATEEEKLAYTEAIIDVVEEEGNKITFQCENIPEIDLPVMLFLGEGGTGSSTLAGLLDVRISANVKPNDFLVYLGNDDWGNKTKDELKLLTTDDELTPAQVAALLALIN